MALNHGLPIQTASLVTAAGTVTAQTAAHWRAERLGQHHLIVTPGDEPALLARAARGGKTENTKHSCLLQECTAVWKGLQTQQSAREASTFTTCSYPETELTSKVINSYIPRNKAEWYWSKRLFERLMEIFQSRPCFLAGKRVTSFPSYRSHPLRNRRVHHLDWRASSVRLSSTHLPYKLCRACSVGIPSSLSAPSTLVSNIPPPPLPTSPNIPRWTFH